MSFAVNYDGVNSRTDLFDDAEFLSYSALNPSSNNPSSFVGMINNGVVFNDLETQVYNKIRAIVTENKKLKFVLQRNNQRLEDHYNKCINLKEKFYEKETDLKRELLEEQNSYKALELMLESYKKAISSNNFSFVSIQPEINNVIENEKGNLIKMLQSIGDEKPEDIVLEAAKGSVEVLQGFSDSPSSEFKNVADLESQLTSIKRSLIDNESSYSCQVKDILSNTIKSIQFSKENSSAHGNTQQITFEQYFELSTRHDASVMENRQLKLEYEELNDSHAQLLKISEQFEILKKKHSDVLAELKEKDEKFVSLINQMDNRSVIIEPLNGKEIEELKAENERLTLMNNELKIENAETMSTFAAVDEENAVLREQNKVYSKEMIEILVKYQQVCQEKAELLKAKDTENKISCENLMQSNNQLEAISMQQMQLNASYFNVSNQDNQMKTRLNELEMMCTDLNYQLEEKTDELAVVQRELESQRNKFMEELNNRNQTYHSQYQAMAFKNEKLKKEVDSLWKTLQIKAQQLKEKDQIENVIREKDDHICTLKVKVECLTEQMQKMNIDLESIPIYQTQMDAYENDFKAERAAREKIHQELLRVNQQLDDRIIENNRLKEEISNLTSGPLLDLQRRYVNPSTMSRYNGARVNPHSPEQNLFNQENNFWGGKPVSAADGTVKARVPYHSEERICPKCQGGFPDLDSLQLHIVECLDN